MNEKVRLQTRVPRHLRDWLKESGKQSNRSMNGQLISVLARAKAEDLEQRLEQARVL